MAFKFLQEKYELMLVNSVFLIKRFFSPTRSFEEYPEKPRVLYFDQIHWTQTSYYSGINILINILMLDYKLGEINVKNQSNLLI